MSCCLAARYTAKRSLSANERDERTNGNKSVLFGVNLKQKNCLNAYECVRAFVCSAFFVDSVIKRYNHIIPPPPLATLPEKVRIIQSYHAA